MINIHTICSPKNGILGWSHDLQLCGHPSAFLLPTLGGGALLDGGGAPRVIVPQCKGAEDRSSTLVSKMKRHEKELQSKDEIHI